jgi:hypothetical protein
MLRRRKKIKMTFLLYSHHHQLLKLPSLFQQNLKKKRNYESPITSRNQKIPNLSLSQSIQNELNSHNINDQDDDNIHRDDDEIQEIVEEQNNKEIQELSQETELNVRKNRKGGRPKKSTK